MFAIKPKAQSYPTWEVHYRPIGAMNEPWQTMNIEARSVLQAEAILRRRGYEMPRQTAIQTRAPGDIVSPVTLQPLLCERCGYELAGLIIEKASVVCPECSYPQPLVAWNPHRTKAQAFSKIATRVFVFLGFLFVALLLSSVLAGVLL